VLPALHHPITVEAALGKRSAIKLADLQTITIITTAIAQGSLIQFLNITTTNNNRDLNSPTQSRDIRTTEEISITVTKGNTGNQDTLDRATENHLDTAGATNIVGDREAIAETLGQVMIDTTREEVEVGGDLVDPKKEIMKKERRRFLLP
jgi:hypothetical protein